MIVSQINVMSIAIFVINATCNGPISEFQCSTDPKSETPQTQSPKPSNKVILTKHQLIRSDEKSNTVKMYLPFVNNSEIDRFRLPSNSLFYSFAIKSQSSF